MMFSNNAEPINMFRINRVTPFKLPSLLGWLGPIRVEFFVGQLAGPSFCEYVSTGTVRSFTTPLSPQPFINGQAFSFKPTPQCGVWLHEDNHLCGRTSAFTAHKSHQEHLLFG